MSKQPNEQNNPQPANPEQAQQPQTQLQIDESQAATHYASTARVWGTSEELIVDFAQGIRGGGRPNVSTMKVDARVIMSPWAAKRLAIALGQAIQRYESTYGNIELDANKRRQQGGGAQPQG